MEEEHRLNFDDRVALTQDMPRDPDCLARVAVYDIDNPRLSTTNACLERPRPRDYFEAIGC
jgi:hypothetical protein